VKYRVVLSTSYKRDLKKVKKQGKNVTLLESVIKIIASGEQLEAKYRDHALRGNFSGCRECHITPDWLLVYRIDKGELELILLHTKSHSDLF